MPHPSRNLLAFAVTSFLLLSPAELRAQVRVALCGAASTSSTACQWIDVQTRLQATTMFSTVDIINVTTGGTGTPTLGQLLAYDALLCWTNSTPANTNDWGDVLADYVDAGGGVVVAVFANSTTTPNRNIGGRWQNGYEVVLDQSGNASGSGATLGTVHQPGHPVMAGVTAFAGGTIGSRPTGTALEVGSTLVAEWSDGKVLVAQGSRPTRIDLGFYPPEASCTQSGWTVGGDQLMTNALLAVAQRAAYVSFGAGCAGTAGTPVLQPTGGSTATLGGVLLVELGQLPQNVGIVGTGFSTQQSGTFTLPLDLGPFGMPGCSLLADPAVNVLLLGGPTAIWPLAIPLNNNLIGVRFVQQGFVLDLGANPTGLAVSNGGTIKIGL